MRRTLAAIALLGFSGAASAAPADDSESERSTLLRIIGEGTAAIAAAACNFDKDRIDRATSTQSDLIRAAAVRIGYADPEILIKIRDEGLKKLREGIERQGSSAHCDTAISKFELMFRDSPR